MRLIAREIEAIKAAATSQFGPDAIVRLFGSRLDDSRRGGDIDLHIELPGALPQWRARSRFLASLQEALGDREFDILYSVRGQVVGKVEQKALLEGVVL